MRRLNFYTLANLNNIIERDGAELLEDYKKINREIKINYKCYCGKNGCKSLKSVLVYGAFCKKCTTDNKIKKKKETCLKTYGFEHATQSEQVRQKTIKTCIERYGAESALECDEIKEKIKETCVQRYGIEYAIQSEEVKQKIKETCIQRYGVEHISQTEEFKEKIKETMINRYGVEHALQCPEFMEKYINTSIERYGVEYASQTPEFREKVKQTCIKNYGVDNPFKVQEVREKCIETNIKRYGVENPSQNQEIQEKTQKNAKKFKEYKMPSGKIIKVQGYEPFALNELVKVYDEEDIITERKQIPRIKYTSNNKSRYYFPDIYIKSENKIIEVKSTWTYKCKTDNIKEKEEATKALGYDYEIWVYDAKGKKN